MGHMTLNPDLEHISGLIGTWKGSGHGIYPTIRDFDYADEWEFRDIGKPFLWFIERTRIGENAAHTETGYLRFPQPATPQTPGTVEFVAAIPTGQSELAEGTCTILPDGTIEIRVAGEVRNTSTAKEVLRMERVFRLSGDSLDYEMEMEAVGQPLSNHLRATLTRTD